MSVQCRRRIAEEWWRWLRRLFIASVVSWQGLSGGCRHATPKSDSAPALWQAAMQRASSAHAEASADDIKTKHATVAGAATRFFDTECNGENRRELVTALFTNNIGSDNRLGYVDMVACLTNACVFHGEAESVEMLLQQQPMDFVGPGAPVEWFLMSYWPVDVDLPPLLPLFRAAEKVAGDEQLLLTHVLRRCCEQSVPRMVGDDARSWLARAREWYLARWNRMILPDDYVFDVSISPMQVPRRGLEER